MITILEIIIAVVVVFLIFSIITFVIVEWIASLFEMRGRTLVYALCRIFEDRTPADGIGKEVYNHPLIKSLQKADKRRPSYIPAAHISAAVTDIISSNNEISPVMKTDSIKPFVTGVQNLPDGPLKTLMHSLTLNATDIESLRKSIEEWFNNCMDRATGWYKRRIKWVIAGVATVVTICFNVDTIFIVQSVKQDASLRRQLNEVADRMATDARLSGLVYSLPSRDNDYFDEYENDASVEESDSVAVVTVDQPAPAGDDVAVMTDRVSDLSHLQDLVGDTALPVGWIEGHSALSVWMVLGWALSVLALSAGAPFWFDVLKKLINLRTSGPKPSSEPK